MKNILIYVFFCLTLGHLRADSVPILDRAILQIGDSIHTQFQIEKYLTFHAFLNRVNLPNQFSDSFWQKALDLYLEDQLVNMEAIRLGGFDPVERNVESKTSDIIDMAAQKSPLTHFGQDQLSSENKTIVRQLLRVREFRLSRDKQKALASKTALDEATWLAPIKAKYKYRFFEEAFVYKKPNFLKSL